MINVRLLLASLLLSAAIFTGLNAQVTIQLNFYEPQKDDTVFVASNYDITWRNSQDITKVTIQLSTDAGNSWTNLVVDYTNIRWNDENTFTWNPGSTSDYARIRIIGMYVDEFGFDIIATVVDSDPFFIQ